MGLERSRRPGILNLQSFRGSETLLRGSNILPPELAIFPLRFYGGLGGRRSFAHECATQGIWQVLRFQLFRAVSVHLGIWQVMCFQQFQSLQSGI